MRHRGGAQREKYRYGKAKNQRNSGAPTFKPMVGTGDKKVGADTEKHIGTHEKCRKHRKHKKRRKSTEKRRKSTEKAQKKEESIRLTE